MNSIDIPMKKDEKIRSFLKAKCSTEKSKKAKVITKELFIQFLKIYNLQDYGLLLKVILIVGVYGLMRCQEIYNLQIKDVTASFRLTKEQNELLGYNVVITKSKTDKKSQGYMFFIPNQDIDDVNPALIIKVYLDYVSDFHSVKEDDSSFWVATKKFGESYKFYDHVVGINWIRSVPKRLAEILQLENPKAYTGHAFRRSGASMFAESGISSANLRRLGRWKSESVAEGYVESSQTHKRTVSEMLLSDEQTKSSLTDERKSKVIVTRSITNEKENEQLMQDSAEFMERFLNISESNVTININLGSKN